jgi:hypothetical protein
LKTIYLLPSKTRLSISTKQTIISKQGSIETAEESELQQDDLMTQVDSLLALLSIDRLRVLQLGINVTVQDADELQAHTEREARLTRDAARREAFLLSEVETAVYEAAYFTAYGFTKTSKFKARCANCKKHGICCPTHRTAEHRNALHNELQTTPTLVIREA